MSCRALEPVSMRTRAPGSSSRSRRVASNPSSTGMLMSIRTTSGSSSRASSIASAPLPARPTISMRSSGARIASSASMKRRWSSATRTRTGLRKGRTARLDSRMKSYKSLLKIREAEQDGGAMADDARERIQKLLLTGDNRLKQGASLAKARESYEQALAVAREAGLEERIRPLVEIRLSDLERLARESPRPAPPGA